MLFPIGLVLLALTPARPAQSAQRNGNVLTPEEVRALLARVATHQHHNDEALMFYERVERRVTRKEPDKAPATNKTFRVVPTGTGTIRVLVEESGRRVPEKNYRQQLRYLEQALMWALEPQESRQKARVQKWARRSRERHETVDAAREAFLCVDAEHTDSQGSLIKLHCSPNPDFKPRTRTEELFQHARAVLWIDPRAAQLARVEAELSSDVSIGGGVLGKVYSGGRFVMEQAAVENTVWLPTRFEYNFRGRKFLFGFELHEVTTVAHYKRIGPPAEALAAVRTELGGGSPANASKP